MSPLASDGVYLVPDTRVRLFQVMPILTPTFPHQNSTFNVTANMLCLITEKMVVAAQTCDRIMKGDDSWETLFKVRPLCNWFRSA